MKLWIFSSIWKHLTKYWNQFTAAKSQPKSPSLREAKFMEIQTKTLGPSTKKKGRLYKFNASDFSDSFQAFPNQASSKTKTIAKKRNKLHQRRPKEDVCPSAGEEVVGNEKIYDDFGDEISSIDGKSSQGSSTTIKEYLSYLDDTLSSHTRDFAEKIKKGERKDHELIPHLYAHQSRDNIFLQVRDLPQGIKCAISHYKLSSVNEQNQQESSMSMQIMNAS